MVENGFEVEEYNSFENMCSLFPYECQSLNKIEKLFSFLNSFLVFKKKN